MAHLNCMTFIAIPAQQIKMDSIVITSVSALRPLKILGDMSGKAGVTKDDLDSIQTFGVLKGFQLMRMG